MGNHWDCLNWVNITKTLNNMPTIYHLRKIVPNYGTLFLWVSNKFWKKFKLNSFQRLLLSTVREKTKRAYISKQEIKIFPVCETTDVHQKLALNLFTKKEDKRNTAIKSENNFGHGQCSEPMVTVKSWITCIRAPSCPHTCTFFILCKIFKEFELLISIKFVLYQ